MPDSEISDFNVQSSGISAIATGLDNMCMCWKYARQNFPLSVEMGLGAGTVYQCKNIFLFIY